MKLSFRPALTLLLGTALAVSFSACDPRYSPGENTQFKHTFTNAPGWHSWDVNRDSINNEQRVEPASGTGSAAANKKDGGAAKAAAGTTAAAVNPAAAAATVPTAQTK